MEISDLCITAAWTLFLDRDGVINRKVDDDYVRRFDDFRFLPGAIEALNRLGHIFGTIVIVTNQRGIAKGLYSLDDLHHIHEQMLEAVRIGGGRVDAVFFCPHMGDEPDCDCRKPKPGMALQAQHAFPHISFSESLVVGDSPSDLAFGQALGMRTVHITAEEPNRIADFYFPSLYSFSTHITKSVSA